MAGEKSSLKCIYPAHPITTRGQFIVLGPAGVDSKGNDRQCFLYYNDKNVYKRNIEKPDVCSVFSHHARPVSVAKYNRNGLYIASGDETGKVLVWSTENESLLPTELQVLGGKVKDIAWSPDTQKTMLKIAVGGEGKESAARIIDAMSGNGKGTIAGQTAPVNQLDYRQTPCAGSPKLRIVTASEDHKLLFFEGLPFKYKLSISDHKNFVNCVRYAPNGEVFISGGADGQALVYNGETAAREGQLEDGSLKDKKAHGGGIYGICFNADGKEIVTVSGDKTAKIWNVADRTLLGTYTMGKELYDMQVGCLWQDNHIMTVSLSGFINYINRDDTSGGIHTPLKTLKGHNRSINTMVVTPDHTKLYSASLYSVGPTNTSVRTMIRWDLASGLAEEIQGTGHTNQINAMVICDNKLITISMDDTVRFTDITAQPVAYGAGFTCKLPSQPLGVAAIQGNQGLMVAVSCFNHIVLVNHECKIVFVDELKFQPTKIDITNAKGSTLVALGGSTNFKKIQVFKLEGTKLGLIQTIESDDDIVDLKFSPDGTQLAAGTGSKKHVQAYARDAADQFTQKYSEGKHTAKVSSVDWRSDSKYFATGSYDGSAAIWGRGVDGKNYDNYVHFMKGIHIKAQITAVRWVSDNVLATCSTDSNIKQFNINL